MNLCPSCFMVGYCSRLNTKIVTNDELKNPDFVNDVLAYAQSLGLRPALWRPYLTKQYASYKGRIVNGKGEEEFLDMTLFEVDEDILFAANDVTNSAKEVSIANNAIREWFEYWLCNPRSYRQPAYISEETIEKLRIVATILRAKNPDEAALWGLKSKAANDNYLNT